jgi:acetyl-CoA synthetase/medium-chain acyl-CoA synthetase
VDRWAQKSPNKRALYWVDDNGNEKSFSFKDLKIRSIQAANYFTSLGITKGDAVMLMLPRIPEWWICLLALIRLGALASPSSTSLRPRDLQHRLSVATIKVIVTYPGAVPSFDSVPEDIAKTRKLVICGDLTEKSKYNWLPFSNYTKLSGDKCLDPHTDADDPLMIYFTSGTTGFPKIVLHKQSYAFAHRVSGEYWQNLNENDLIYCITDTGWVKAIYSTCFGQWHIGACVFIYNNPNFTAPDILNLLIKYKITVLCAPPTAYRKIVLENLRNYKFPHLRHCLSAGEPLNPEPIKIWKEGTGLDIYEGYGQSESTILVCTTPDMVVKPGAMGKAVPGVQVEIIDDNLQRCEDNVEGHIAVKVKPFHPPNLFCGYSGDGSDKKNKECFQGDWYLSGDRAYRDADGYLWFVSRADDVIKSSGYRIGPFEVESAFVTHKSVVESAVVGIPHETRGQVIKAFVVLKPEYEGTKQLNDEILLHVKGELAHYQVPSFIEFVPDLPKTVSGKIRRTELREMEIKKIKPKL